MVHVKDLFEVQSVHYNKTTEEEQLRKEEGQEFNLFLDVQRSEKLVRSCITYQRTLMMILKRKNFRIWILTKLD